MQTQATALPNWDMSDYFSGLGAEDYRLFWRGLTELLRELAQRVSTLPPVEREHQGVWAGFLLDLETVGVQLHHIGSYLSCLGAADAHNDAIRAEASHLTVQRAAQDKILASVRIRLAAAAEAEFNGLLLEPRLEGAAYWLQRQRELGRRSMSPELEALAADLQVDGLSAWSRLYDQLSGKLMFDLEAPGRPAERVPVSRTRSLLEDPDPAVRKAALQGANAAWAGIGDTLAACLNGIAGTRLNLYERRGGMRFLEPALFDAGIEEATLGAMFEAVSASKPILQGYLLQKARLLGLERLGFQDLMAPVGASAARPIRWEEAVRLIVEVFGGFHSELADFARMAVQERWIDHDPRPGKKPGAFCSSSHILGQSRVFVTYDDRPADLLTLAHELGHGFHNWVMRDQRPWARGYPMTLAETASIFCEQVVMDALLSRAASREEQLGLLDMRLQDAAVFLMNIPMRFWFECRFYEERAAGELSVHQLQELMLAAQKRAYGDALAAEELDPWFWASKLHFYIGKLSFYNFPYTFGYLFSMGLFARARKSGAEFMPWYRELLRQTASAPAEEVARRNLGVTLGAPGFWQESVDLVAADARAFEALTAMRGD